MEYRKGILFIRLKGNLTKNTYKSLNSYLLPVIKNQGIKYIVYNLGNVSVIDNFGTKSIEAGIMAVKRNHGNGLICNSRNLFNPCFKIVDNELSALETLTI